MKLTKKKVLVAAIALSLVAIVSVSTLAWFQATDEVTNYFKVSTDDETQRPDFKLDLFEHEHVDGILTEKEVEENTYEHVAPGDVLKKDPTVRNDGQYDQWVRVIITLADYDEWEAALGDKFEFNKCFVDFNDAWVLDKATAGTDTLVFYYNAKLLAGEEAVIFQAFYVPADFTVENMPVEFQLDIVAEAIQADNTGSSAQEAFANYWN